MFNFGGNKVKSITISPSDKYVIWEEKLEDLAKDCTLIVNPGCEGLYIVNGALRSNNPPGRWLINSREDVRENSQIKLIGVNSDKVFDVFCGVGNLPWHDYFLQIDAKVGAFGDCKIQISDPWLLFTTIGHTPITATEIDEFAKSKLIEIMGSHIAKAVEKYDYQGINSKKSEISDVLAREVATTLFNYGIKVVSFSIRGINFDEEYLKKREKHFDDEHEANAAEEERRRKEREMRSEAEFITSIMNAGSSVAPQAPSPSPITPIANQSPNHTTQFCPQCGTQLPATAKFCSNCGRDLN